MKDVPEKKPTNDRQTGPAAPASRTGGLSPHSVQRLQGAAGNAAVARLVAQRYTAPVKTPANAAPGFRRVGADVAAKKRTMAAHAPAAAESKSAQDAAVAPPDDKEAQGKAANAEKMNAAKPGEFDKAAFVAAVDKAIEAQAPKNLDEADKFSKSGKADKVKDEVDGKVGEGKDTSAKDIETTTKAPPDTSAAKDKPVTPMSPDRPPANPGAPSASDAIPEKQPPAVTDFSQGPAENDKTMADAEVTEEQLAKGNEPEFDDALKAKKTAETDSAKAPGKAHTAEDQQLATAKAGAAAAGAQAMTTLTATRAAAGKAVDGGKGETKSKDEQKRAEVTAKLQKVFDATKKDVEATLTGLDQKVDTAFTTGEKSARDAFTADHKARMKKYKDKRYSGFLGKGRWLKDKFAGLPKEANDLYQESRKLYVARMRTVISSVADMIGVELGRAKTRIAQGRTELKAEVDRLPADLKAFGEEAQQDFAGKFEDLEASVDEKSEQLVQDLANKYTAALNAVDEEIKKLQEANKGLIDKAKDAIAGVIKTINELKNLLLGILAKAASAIVKIIKDPIGFLGNLVKAVGAGLNLFITNIGTHLKTGLVSWLLGTATKAGLELPQRFDLRGIIQLIASLLGLTWENIRTRITRKGVPDEAMTAVESTVPVAQSLAKEGPAGAVKEIQAEAGDLKSTILSKLTEYLVPTVIIAGVTWILSLLNPASAFVRAVKGIIDIVTFVVTQGAQIADFVNAVLDAVIQIANGGAAGVPKMVETALAASVPLLIGFLAALLGIGNLANKVRSVFQAVSRPVNRAIDKIVDFIAKKGKALWRKAGERNPSPYPGKNARGFPGEANGEREALKQSELVLSSENKVDDVRTRVARIAKKFSTSLRVVVTPKKPEGDEVYVQAARTGTHLLPPGECTPQDKKIVDDEIDNFGRNRLQRYSGPGVGSNRMIRRVSIEEDYDNSVSGPAEFLERQRNVGRGQEASRSLRFRPRGRSSAAVQDVRDLSRRGVVRREWEFFLMEMRDRAVAAFEKSGGYRRKAGPLPGQLNVGEIGTTTGRPKPGGKYLKIAAEPPRDPQLFMEAVLALQHGRPSPPGLSEDELDRAASLARLSHIEAARGTGASVTESLANFLASRGALGWGERYGPEQPMVLEGSGVTARFVHDELNEGSERPLPSIKDLGIRAQSDYPKRTDLKVGPDEFMERERNLLKRYACWHITETGISGNERAIRNFVRRELEKHLRQLVRDGTVP
ncbi:hypothetical protein ACFVU3_03395 [Streptomyces sp. NPDC058052]|uniref:hypothetical protein n=1 Tax=Streptomyces sp. NPDC058052 TaxID=3346316 RepID=UPI0036EBBB9B